MRIWRRGAAVIPEPVATDWTRLDALAGRRLDDDAIGAAEGSRGQQDRPALDALFR